MTALMGVSPLLLLVAAGERGLLVYQLKRGSGPRALSEWKTAGPAVSVAVIDGLAAVGCGARGLEIVDLSDPFGNL